MTKNRAATLLVLVAALLASGCGLRPNTPAPGTTPVATSTSDAAGTPVATVARPSATPTPTATPAPRPVITSQGLAKPQALALVRRNADLVLVALDGSRGDQVIVSGASAAYAGSVRTASGAEVYWSTPAPTATGADRVLQKIAVRTGARSTVLTMPMNTPQVSPDGKRVAYSLVEGDYLNVYVRDFAVGSSARIVSAHRIAGCRQGAMPRVIAECFGTPAVEWAADGGALFYRVGRYEEFSDHFVDLSSTAPTVRVTGGI